MFTRILLGVLFVAGLAGCATTHRGAAKADGDQMQARVVELEKKLEEKDSEIVDLQYEVKDLSSKMESGSKSSYASSDSAPVSVAVVKGDDIIRVSTTAVKLQTALKAAGVYSGKVDGKVGSGTKAAVVAFQKAKGLTADGVVGRKTWDELKQYLN